MAAGSTEVARTVLYPGPEEVLRSNLYEVRVNGEPLFVYHVTVNPSSEYQNISAPGAMAYFDFSGEVTVEVKARRGLTSVVVRPLSRCVEAVVRGDTATFTLSKPGNFFIEINGSRDNPLFLFANPIETDPPAPDDPNVVYFGPGVHAPGLIELQSGQTLYLAGGSFVKGRFKTENARGVKIRGRGILYGGEYRKADMGDDKFIMFRRCQDVLVEGIIALDAFGWNFMIAGSRNVTVDNVKIIGWRMNSDGINPVSSEKVTIRNCFIKSQDDGISVKGIAAWGSRIADILVTGCVMWQNWMRSFVLGGELAVNSTENIVFRDSDILYSGVNPKSAGNRDAALSVWNVDAARAGDVTFEDIRVEEAVRLVRLALFKNKHSRQPEWGHIDGVSFRNIRVFKGPAAIELSGHSESNLIQNVTFEDLEIEGKLIRSPQDLKHYSADPFTRNVKFVVTR
jgi:polygalacturonase